jgi:hypothetical protein
MYMHNWYHSNVSSILYIHGHNCNVQLYMAYSPCFVSLCRFPFASPSGPSLLTWNPPSCDRIRSPRSQVACKLTSPVPTLCPNPPPSKFPEPQLLSALLRRPQEQSGVFCLEHSLRQFCAHRIQASQCCAHHTLGQLLLCFPANDVLTPAMLCPPYPGQPMLCSPYSGPSIAVLTTHRPVNALIIILWASHCWASQLMMYSLRQCCAHRTRASQCCAHRTLGQPLLCFPTNDVLTPAMLCPPYPGQPMLCPPYPGQPMLCPPYPGQPMLCSLQSGP